MKSHTWLDKLILGWVGIGMGLMVWLLYWEVSENTMTVAVVAWGVVLAVLCFSSDEGGGISHTGL